MVDSSTIATRTTTTLPHAIVLGGLHHCVADLPRTFRTIARLLRRGGTLMMFEPNSRYLLEFARRIWYRLDRRFDHETEHALDHDAILAMAAPFFDERSVRYCGGPAPVLILNSLVLRVPLRLKPRIAPPLFALERLSDALPGRWPHRRTKARASARSGPIPARWRAARSRRRAGRRDSGAHAYVVGFSGDPPPELENLARFR